MKCSVWLALFLGLLTGATATPRNDGREWRTLHGDLQRSGYYSSFPAGKLRLAWRKELWRELTGPRAEVIVGQGLAFMGTYAGNFYAWSIADGAERWVFRSGGPIGHSPAFSDGVVTDGVEPWVAPILYTGGLHNPLTPPCFNPETGDVFTQIRSAYTTWDGGGEVRPFTGFGKFDLKTGRVALVDHGYKAKDPSRPAGDKDKPWGSFNYIGDETQTLSCSAGQLLCNHQGNLGALDLETGLISNLHGKRDSYGGFYGGANFGWENQGGFDRAKAAGQPYGLVNEWHGPARSIVSVAGSRVFFPVGSQVICLEGTK